ncbi:MAG: cobalt-precorrin-5B (C(1))-methyltransferase [Lentisphaerales bacterium]|nr:cobalt-precorrin-5B (C(1))-methyltransferase [Lentisphaerales bacterium]
MAKVNTAEITGFDAGQKGTRIVHFKMINQEPLKYIGGQYIILNSGIKLGEDKFSKGSYTLLPGQDGPASFSVAFRKVGICSEFFTDTAKLGDHIEFSGPWGAKKFENFLPEHESLFAVTDTGITAVIALLNGAACKGILQKSHILWYRSSEDDFLSIDQVKSLLPSDFSGDIQQEFIAKVGFSIRNQQCRAILKKLLETQKFKHAVLAGDGDVLPDLQQDLYASGIDEDIPMDWFFNNPKKKVDAKDPKNLRTGFTTGACSAAAAKAAVKMLVQKKTLNDIETILPNGNKVTFKLKVSQFNDDGSATCSVIKDAGDDPDCTDKAELTATVKLSKPEGVTLHGGNGVATVTKDGLGLGVGGPAINPVPRKNITEMVLLELEDSAYCGADVTISVPGGQRMAKETMNERLGLIGGISILGTTGIVRPYSTAAYRASIIQAVNLAGHSSCQEVVLTTGGRSEQYAMQLLPELKEVAFIQVGDFIGSSLKAVSKAGLKKAIIVGMIGKLSKMADGKTQTHQAGSSVNMELLAEIASELGATESVKEEILKANTARHVLEIAQANGLDTLCSALCQRVSQALSTFIKNELSIDCYLVDFEGGLLGKYKS